MKPLPVDLLVSGEHVTVTSLAMATVIAVKTLERHAKVSLHGRANL